MEFWRYYRVLRRRRWIVAAALLAAIAAGIALGRQGLGDYEATAIVTAPPAQRFYFVTGTVGSAAANEDPAIRVASIIGVIRSYGLAERVVQRFHLSMQPMALQKKIRADKESISNAIKISTNGRTPNEAVMLANAVADTIAAYNPEVQAREVTRAREFAEARLAATRAALQALEDQLVAFEKKNGVSLAASRISQVQTLDTEIRENALALKATEVRLPAVLAQLDGQSVNRIAQQQITDNPVFQQLRNDLLQLEVALNSELALHTEKYPAVIALRTKIQAIKEHLKAELTKIVSSEQVAANPIYDSLNSSRINLATERLVLLAKRDALDRVMRDVKRAFPSVAEKRLEESRLEREIDTLGKQLLGVYVAATDARIRERDSLSLAGPDVVDYARKAKLSLLGARFKLTLAVLLGLFGGVGLAFFQEYLDNTLKTPEEAERLFGVPALAVVPHHNPPFDEAYRLLCTNLAVRNGQEGTEAFLVTSPRPREGTSTVVANLARAFARTGRRTIVVDANFQQPTQHVHFGVANGKGLGQVLAGEATLQNALIETNTSNLWVLPSGIASEKTGKIEKTDGFLSAKAMAGLLADLKRMGDVILLDTPSAGVFSDVLAIAPLVSGVLLVFDASRAPRGGEEQVRVRLERMGAKVLGVVMTKVRPDLVDSYVYQRRFYKKAPRRKLSAAAATIGALALIVGMGVLGGASAWATRTGKSPFAIPHVMTRWLSSAIHHTPVPWVYPFPSR